MNFLLDALYNIAINNTLFVNMKIYNRGNYNLNDVYVGTWTDYDLGYYLDDYVGCNVPKNLGTDLGLTSLAKP